MGVGGTAHFDVRADRRWLTAAEAAAENLPGLDYDERHIRRWLEAERVPTRLRAASGSGRKGREFRWDFLPPQAAAEYLKRYGAADHFADPGKMVPAVRTATKDLRAEARRIITDAALAFVRERNTGVEKGLAAFAALYARRKTKLDPWIYGIEPDAAPHRLRAWDRKIRHHGAGALIDHRGRPEKTGLFDRDKALRAYAVAAIAARPHLSCPQLRLAIATDLHREIPLRTVQAFVSTFRAENQGALKALANPDAHRSHHKPAFGSRSTAITRINQLWEIDATRADAMCLTEDGTRKRFAITSVIDVRTRRACMLVSDQPRALATQALLRRALLAWGQCETLKLDNGKEFAARAVTEFCRATGIALHFSRPFHPEEKPHVERMFGTLNHGLFPLLPGFVGANVAERKGIDARASFQHRFGEEARLTIETSLSPEGLQARLDAWLREIYEHAPHDGLKGKTPFATALALGADARRIADERALDALLLPAPEDGGTRLVVKRGIRVANRWYIHPELGEFCARHARVSVRLDPHDASRIVVYSADGGAFVCIAECIDEMPSQRRQEIAVRAGANAAAAVREIRDDVRKVQRIFPANGLADRILEGAGWKPAVQLLPDASAAMEAAANTPKLIEARRAADALASRETIPCPEEPTAEARAAYEAHVIDMERKTAPPAPRLVQCEGYTRPDFIDDDFGFYAWAEVHTDSLDAIDRENFRKLQRDEIFQTMRRQRAAS